MYQQVLRETASQYMNSGIVDGVISSMKIKEDGAENNYYVTPT
jgi:outer membrane protein assembly factor BamA